MPQATQLTKGDLYRSYAVADYPVPRFKDEDWRYIPLRRLRGLHDGTFEPAVAADVTVTLGDDDAAGQDSLSGVPVTTEVLQPGDPRLGRTGAPVDRVGAQAWESAPEAQYVRITGEVSDTITITVRGRGEGVTSFGTTVIELTESASANVIVRYQGSGTHAENVELLLGDNSRLAIVFDANWERDAVHVAGAQAKLGRDAVLRCTVATFGGDLVRFFPRVQFTQPGADAELLGIYFAEDGQFFENRLLVDHDVPQCRSNVMYKGALQGPAEGRHDTRTAWVGDVIIRAAAEGTSTYEVNRNLVLNEHARADAVPNLEIETGEIEGAGHAATVGRFDEEQVFYLQSRGIPEEEARRLIVHGFFNEVITQIPVEAIRRELTSRVSAELDAASPAHPH